MQENTSERRRTERKKINWDAVKRAAANLAVTTTHAFLQGIAMTAGAALVTKLLTQSDRSGNVMKFPNRRIG